MLCLLCLCSRQLPCLCRSVRAELQSALVPLSGAALASLVTPQWRTDVHALASENARKDGEDSSAARKLLAALDASGAADEQLVKRQKLSEQ